MAENTYNLIYKKLVEDNSDAVGMFAYALYKQQKIAFVENIIAEQGREPTAEELATFHRTSMLEPSIKGYKEQAESLVSAFLTESLSKELDLMQNDVKDSVLVQHLETIKAQLDSRKTWHGWVSDVSVNLFVNILTIILLGIIALGYQYYDGIISRVERVVGLVH